MTETIHDDQVSKWFRDNRFITIDEKTALRMLKELTEKKPASPRQNHVGGESGFGKWSGPNTKITTGGVMTYADGETIKIDENENRIGLEFHGRTVYEYYYYPKGRPNYPEDYPADVIQFRVLPADSYEWTGWLMNIEDAVHITSYLMKATWMALQAGHSPGPLFEEGYEDNSPHVEK